MKHLKTYIKLVRRAQNRTPPLFGEKHHIFPRSIFGKNNVIVKLTYVEHLRAHRLLWLACKERYGVTHKRTHKMATAYLRMTSGKTVNEKQFAEARRAVAESMTGPGNPMFGKPGTFKGRKHTEESKKKLRASKQKNYAAILRAASMAGKAVQARKTPEERSETARKMGAATKGISKAVGYRWFNNGVSERKLAMIPEGWQLGRLKFSEDTKRKMSLANKDMTFVRVTCPKCGKQGAKPVMSRFHFSACRF